MCKAVISRSVKVTGLFRFPQYLHMHIKLKSPITPSASINTNIIGFITHYENHNTKVYQTSVFPVPETIPYAPFYVLSSQRHG
jgi:hypothetical protein